MTFVEKVHGFPKQRLDDDLSEKPRMSADCLTVR